MLISYGDFAKVDMRIGVIIKAETFPQAHKPAYRLEIDFGGDIGVKKSSAQITTHYQLDELVGQQVVAIVNFPARQIGPFLSQVLVLGVADEAGEVVLLTPQKQVPLGGRVF